MKIEKKKCWLIEVIVLGDQWLDDGNEVTISTVQALASRAIVQATGVGFLTWFFFIYFFKILLLLLFFLLYPHYGAGMYAEI